MMNYFNLPSTALYPFLCGIVVIIVGYIKLWKLRKTDQPEKVELISIWLMGVIGLLLGYFSQILNTIQAFDAIEMARDISPEMVAGGVKSGMKSVLIGIAVLIISLVIWGILKVTKQNRIRDIVDEI